MSKKPHFLDELITDSTKKIPRILKSDFFSFKVIILKNIVDSTIYKYLQSY